MRQLEFKAELRDPTLGRLLLIEAGARSILTLMQTDVYLAPLPDRPGLLVKIRSAPGEPTEYIAYERPDRLEPSISEFEILSEADGIARYGPAPAAPALTVRKRREVLMRGGVRIHLDDVDGLGSFIEFEAMVTPSQTLRTCQDRLAELRAIVLPAMGEPISTGYAEMLRKQSESGE